MSCCCFCVLLYFKIEVNNIFFLLFCDFFYRLCCLDVSYGEVFVVYVYVRGDINCYVGNGYYLDVMDLVSNGL